MAGQNQFNRAGNIQENYPLSPMQQGMLFHGLSAPHSGVDIEQVICALPEEVNVVAFHQAWERAVERHAILRTGFSWSGLEPRQEVHRRVRLHFEQKDWRGLEEREQEYRLEAFLQAERRRGFELAVPPLMRLALFRVAETKSIFAWTFHHLLLDGRSLAVLLNEVFQFYEAFCQGRDLKLEPVRPYREYVQWLHNQDSSGAEAFWRKALKGFYLPTPLPAARPVSKATGPVAGHGVQQVVLPSSEMARFRALAKEHELTLSTLLQGAWAVLLSRYTGEEDVVFGAIRAGRRSTIPGAESMAGLFIITLPVRVRVVDEMRVLGWLKELRAWNVAMRDFKHNSLVKIQGWSEVPRATPLFETVFNFQDPAWDAVLHGQGGKWARREFAIRNQPNFPLWLDVYGGPELTLKIGYDPGRYDDAVIARMLDHFTTLLGGMAADLSQQVGDLPLLGEREERQLIIEWNRTQADYPQDKCVHELFESQVVRTPNAVALVSYKEKEVSYRELDNQANRVARHLRSLGVGPDVPVGICAERSAEMVVGLLGILKAGGAYVPLDPAYPQERLAFMIEDSQAPVLLAQESLRRKFNFNFQNCRVAGLEELRRDSRGRLEPSLPQSSVTPDNLAYIIYTSGSTGKPKGVEIPHRGLVNLLSWHQQTYCVTPADRATQLAGFSFDASVWELWPYLTAGASIHVVDEETRASSQKLAQWLAAKKITISFLPTPLAEETLTQRWPDNIVLRVMLTGGDKLQRRPGADLPFGLVNHYGPTENTVVTTFTPVAPAEENLDTAPPIGRPIANGWCGVEIFFRRPVPIGVPGELYIGGDSLACGYRNNPELTAEKFVFNPFNTDSGSRLYKTGDLVRRLPDGNVEFLGRIDQQVKVRGYRIEPGEIEALLNQHPAVRESLVEAREDGRGQKQLVAYLVAQQESRPPVKELSDFLKTKLPDYMTPSVFLFLEAWPLTPNGKVNRRALPTPDWLKLKSGQPFTAPRNLTEETVVKVWSEILGRAPIGVYDNFFELGGHSLLAAQVVARLKETLNLGLSIRSLFEKPTADELAREIERLKKRRATVYAPGLARVARDAYRVNPPSRGSRTAATTSV